MRVLVVDDSAAVRTRLVALIRASGAVEVDEAATADEALETARARAPDLVVLDLHLPGKSGLAIVGALKVLPSSPTVAVLTSHPTDVHRRLCLAQGADHFFDKSADVARVLDLLARPTPDAT